MMSTGRRTYLTRTGIQESGKVGTIHVPVQHTGQQANRIREARIDSTQWRPERLGRRLHHAYGKSPFWDELSPALLGTLNQEHRYLMELNQALLLWIGVELLDLSPSAMVFQSELQVEGKGSRLMANLTRTTGGTHYLSGGHAPRDENTALVGAAAYNRIEDFTEQGIELVYQNFTPLPYRQPFLPGLSALDCLFWLGPRGTREHLESYSFPGSA